jgi:RHS repeat-associated protein
VVERAVYKPFGEQTEWLTASQPAPESKGWIGERFDADAGLQYLNARYYDPVLGPPQENDPPDHFLTFVDHPARLVRCDETWRGDQSVQLCVK